MCTTNVITSVRYRIDLEVSVFFHLLSILVFIHFTVLLITIIIKTNHKYLQVEKKMLLVDAKVRIGFPVLIL